MSHQERSFESMFLTMPSAETTISSFVSCDICFNVVPAGCAYHGRDVPFTPASKATVDLQHFVVSIATQIASNLAFFGAVALQVTVPPRRSESPIRWHFTSAVLQASIAGYKQESFRVQSETSVVSLQSDLIGVFTSTGEIELSGVCHSNCIAYRGGIARCWPLPSRTNDRVAVVAEASCRIYSFRARNLHL